MKKKPVYFLSWILIFIVKIDGTVSVPLKLWYRNPATTWNEALPVGNGRLGAMIFGNPCVEHIQLNEESVWTGLYQDADNPEALEYLPLVRDYLIKGNYVNAQRLMAEKMSCKKTAFTGEDGTDNDYGSYQTLGDLTIFFDHDTSPITDYYRDLNLRDACASVSYSCKSTHFYREVFSSAVHQVLVIRLEASQEGALNCRFQLSRPESASLSFDGSDLIMQGQLHHGKGLHYGARMRIILEEGKYELDSDQYLLKVNNATHVTILIAAGTNFKDNDFHATIKNHIENAAHMSYADLKKAHISDYQKLFNRVELDLGKTSDDLAALSTDERIACCSKKKDDPELINLYFQFGRYLLISSSRPGTLPANLQGIWADTLQTPWNGDYHLNINLQMNYWPAEVTNLSECHEPLCDYIALLQEPGSKTAKTHYGARGWVTHWASNIWGFTSPGKYPRWGFFPTAAGWLCRHLWDHYCFTADKKFLERAYPVMKGASEFCIDFLVEEPKNKWLVTSPSSSPENSFTVGWQMASICMGPSLDQQIVWDLFKNTSEAARILNCDNAFSRELDEKRARLAPPQISKRGALMEWLYPVGELEPGHRHMSHLFALCPGEQIRLYKTPDLADAAKKSLEQRLRMGGGHTGWSQAWIVNLWARLGKAELAYQAVKRLLRKSTLPNLLDSHPSFQSDDHLLFEIDGNFGGTAGIAEMLLQSYLDEIHLLPALPDAWPCGSWRGLCARGAIEIDCSWENKKLTQVTLRPKVSSSYTIRVPQGNLCSEATHGVTWQQRDDCITVTLTAHSEYQLFFST